MEKLLTVTDKSALWLGVSVGQFLGEAESNIEFEQVFGYWSELERAQPLTNGIGRFHVINVVAAQPLSVGITLGRT